MMRGRRQERREERQGDRSFGRRGSGNKRYQMREMFGKRRIFIDYPPAIKDVYSSKSWICGPDPIYIKNGKEI